MKKSPYSIIASILGRRGGLMARGKTSDLKKRTSKENGKKGGRPKKIKEPEEAKNSQEA